MARYWEDYTPEQLNTLADTILLEYRSKGFPYYSRLSREECQKLKNDLQKKSWRGLIHEDTIKQTMHGLGAIWAYFPHAWEVQCGKSLTPMQVFNSDELFKKAILKRLKYGTYVSDSGIRKSLKTASGAQGVSNFRPSAAAAIYDYFGAENVYDMSCGYGGRMLGAIISKSVKSYMGVDPCVDTFNGLMLLKEDFSDDTFIDIKNCGSEEFSPEANSIDLCFTSPPYFNTEKYSEECTQSYKKYPTYIEWVSGFIGGTVDNCVSALKPNGVLAYNVANTKISPNLVDDVKQVLISRNLVDYGELRLSLSSIMSKGFKYEPVLIFRKPV